ncbi:MAG: Nre family DNA repair protein [Desulfurococcales archaeon]|nr:Nre family DNA repair protein [Desulfurococcales archaeon]
MKRINPALCAVCKGYKKLCGLPRCPILDRYLWQIRSLSNIDSGELHAPSPPAIIVGEYGYPYVRVYYSTAPGSPDPRLHDDPLTWIRNKYPLDYIVGLRSQLVSGIIKAKVGKPEELYSREISLAAVSVKPVDTDLVLEKKPSPTIRFDGITKPVGPASPARAVVIEGNPRVPRVIEKLYYDELSARKSLWTLYESGIDVYTAVKAFTLGMMGSRMERRLVPTRWGITAVDSTIGDILHRRVRTFKTVNEIEVYHEEYLGNSYTIILAPGSYEAEWIEIWYPNTLWTRGTSKPTIVKVVEQRNGKQSVMDGGYLAARFSVLEHLYRRRRQAVVLIIREVFPSYYAPVGNWQIRESVRTALVNPPVNKPLSTRELIQTLSKLVRYDVNLLVRQSTILKRMLYQARLDSWMK